MAEIHKVLRAATAGECGKQGAGQGGARQGTPQRPEVLWEAYRVRLICDGRPEKVRRATALCATVREGREAFLATVRTVRPCLATLADAYEARITVDVEGMAPPPA